MSQKKYIIAFFCFAVVWTAILAVSNYILDPFRIYHTPFFASGKYIANDRYQNAGLIADDLVRKKCCDSVLIGTSLSQNFDTPNIDNALKWKNTLNLTMAGSKPLEQKALLTAALSTHEVRHVLWELYDSYYSRSLGQINPPERIKKEPGTYFPAYLYDDKKFNDARYIFSLDPLISTFWRVKNGKPLEDIKEWYTQQAASFGKGKDVAAASPDIHRQQPEYTVFETLSPVDDVVIQTIAAHPDVKFELYIPPYSLHYYAQMTPQTYADMMGMRVYLAQRLQKFPNARLHFLDRRNRNIENLDLYKDLTHFHPDFYDEMLDEIRDSSAMVKPAGMGDYINLMTGRVNRYVERQSE